LNFLLNLIVKFNSKNNNTTSITRLKFVFMFTIVYLSYVLNFISVSLLFVSGIKIYFFPLHIDGVLSSLIITIIFMFTKILIMFYFIGSAKAIKSFIVDNALSLDIYKPLLNIKNKLFPQLLLNMILFGTHFILLGGVHTNQIPKLVNGILFIFSFLHLLYVIRIEHISFKKNFEVLKYFEPSNRD